MQSKRFKRLKLWIENSECYVCKREILNFSESSLEHKIPKSRGGTDNDTNISISHRQCNRAKGNLVSPADWIPNLKINFKKSQTFPELNEEQIWTLEKDEVFIRKLIIKSFSDNEYIMDSLNLFPRFFYHRFQDSHAHIKAYCMHIQKLRNIQNLEDLIQKSSVAHNLASQSYWKIIFGLIFLEKYLSSNDPFAHELATNEFKTFKSSKPYVVLYQYSKSLVDHCRIE
jgi:HNH endonuclease